MAFCQADTFIEPAKIKNALSNPDITVIKTGFNSGSSGTVELGEKGNQAMAVCFAHRVNASAGYTPIMASANSDCAALSSVITDYRRYA